jgi:peptide-methionine (R)-S-oxide reductase
MTKREDRDDARWRDKLTDEQYRVARGGGTELPFSGVYDDHYEPGTYRCVCCHEALFSSDSKYKSGSGWPSFFQPIEGAPLELRRDASHGMERVEVRCQACGAHLGHVFEDGPAPTGTRYCINSAALDFEERE